MDEPRAGPIDLAGLDVADLNHVLSSEALRVLDFHPSYRRRGLALGMTRFAAKAVRGALRSWRAPSWRGAAGGGVLVVVETLNQHAAIRPVLEAMPEAATLALRPGFGPLFPEAAAYARAVPFLPTALRRRRAATGYLRDAFDRAFDEYLLAYGYVAVAARVLERLRPRLLVLVNDHNLRTRALALAARHRGVPTAYVQHATVSARFPPLAFDLSLLDGRDAAEKYARAGPGRGEAYLVGIAKADAVRRRRRPPPERCTVLGLCVNTIDPTLRVEAFARALASSSPATRLVIRAHPSDTRPWGRTLGLEASDARSEDVHAFLRRVDGVASGPSNVILDAALAGVPAVYVDFAGRGADPYGFVEHGLCDRVDDAARVVPALEGAARGWDARERVLRRYSATVGTPYDGRSAELIARLLRSRLAGAIDRGGWRRTELIPGVPTYELA